MKVLALSGSLRAGSINSALDWLVSFEPFAFKPVAVLNSSGRSIVADAAVVRAVRDALMALRTAISGAA